MNVKVAKPSATYKVVAETFGERYMAISTLYNYILHDRSIGCYNVHTLVHIHVYFRFLGRGLITLLDFDSWRPRRSLYDPTFTKRLALV